MASATYGRSTTVITVTLAAHGYVVGQLVFFNATAGAATSGSYPIATVPTANTFTLTDKVSGTITAPFACTVDTPGVLAATYSRSGNYVTVDTVLPHGLIDGQEVRMTFLASGATDGTYRITKNTDYQFSYRDPVNGSISGGTVAYFLPRPFFSWPVAIDSTESCTAVTRLLTLSAPWILSSSEFCAGEARQINIGGEWEITSTESCQGDIITSAVLLDLEITSRETCAAMLQLPMFANWEILAVDFCVGGQAEFTVYGTPDPALERLELVMQLLVARANDTVTNVLDDAARSCGYLDASQMLPSKQERLLDDLNAALQVMYSRARNLDYFNQTTQRVTVPITGTVTLGATVQQVHGHVRLATDQRPLVLVRTRSEIERYAALYLTADEVSAGIHGYYVERQGAAGTAQGFTTTLIFSPAPATETEVDVEVSLDAPRFSWSDYVAGTALSIPQRYAQSVLYPLVRHRLLTNIDFAQKEVIPMIEAQYEQARQTLGLIDPAPSKPAEPAA